MNTVTLHLMGHLFICLGFPSKLNEVESVDWAPTVNLSVVQEADSRILTPASMAKRSAPTCEHDSDSLCIE